MSTRPPSEHDSAREFAEALAWAKSGEDLESSDAPPPKDPPRKSAKSGGFYPDLNPTQDDIFNDPADNVLGHGEKGSGKSVGFGHKIVRHCYENDNALALVIAPSMRTGNEGIWYDLDSLILPQWRDGMDLEYTASKLDPITKDRHRWIRNMHGGWSKVLLMSIMFPSQVEGRVKGPAPSLVYIDEITNCDGEEYYIYPAAQLGRRRGITGPQQFLASCNPKGPSHWVYKHFFVEHAGDPSYSVHHVPIKENIKRLPPGYVERLEKIFKTDPIEYKRLISGEWIDRPTGKGLFLEYFVDSVHVKGSFAKGLGLRPQPGFPILVGYDLGQVYSSITFMQAIPIQDGRIIWIIFDEVDSLGEKVLYRELAKKVMVRMRYWRELCDYKFAYDHISDSSAVNQWRPGGDGSYDAWEFEKEYAKCASEFGLRSIKIKGCPKGSGSVAARVRLVQSKLAQDELYISATCPNTKDSLMNLEADDKDPDKPKRSRFLHKFDSLSYPMFKLEMRGLSPVNLPSGRVATSLIKCGQP